MAVCPALSGLIISWLRNIEPPRERSLNECIVQLNKPNLEEEQVFFFRQQLFARNVEAHFTL